MKKQDIITLIVITFIGMVLRFYMLGAVPDSLNWDEVSWGYNGYSIWQTGRDEHGEFLPLSFEAFGDFKQPVYVYLNALTIGIFGLSAFAVRLPSAFLGTLSIIGTYLFVYELFFHYKHRNIVSLISAALIAVSPWSVQFSRVAFEANVGQFFVLLGAWLFIRGIRIKNWWLLSVSTVPLAISAYTYHSEKLFTPLLFGGLLVYGHSFFIQNKLKTFVIVVLFIVLNIPWLIDGRTTSRGRSVTFASSQTQILEPSLVRLSYEQESNLFLGSVFYNRRIVYATRYVENYLKHFDPNFLFVTGDNARHHPPGMGVLYLVSLPFIIAGMYFVIRMKHRSSFLLFLWLFLAPAASALAIDAPNASRSLIFLPTWQILTAMGIIAVYASFTSPLRKRIYGVGIGIVYVLSVLYFSHQYFSHTNTDMQTYWQYGYKEAVQEAEPYTNAHALFLHPSVEQGYIFYLFHTAYSPAEYIQKEGFRKIADDCKQLDRIYDGICSSIPRQPGDILVTTKLPEASSYRIINQFTSAYDPVTVSVLQYE